MSESGAADFFFLPGPSPGAVARQYSRLTGTSAMPPAFSLGYHQCRWNYRDEADVKEVDGTFDELDIPYDVLWLDIEHTDGKRYMTWDAAHFPTPRRMIEDVASRGRKMVTIVDPHVKKDPNYPTHAEAERKRLYVRTPTGEDFDGWCWPGSSAYLDVVSSAVRDWWAEKFSLANYPGSTHDLHVWNDMNEPSVFNGPEITMRKDLTHVDGTVEHREVHNAFGMYYHAATAQGLRMRKNAEETERPLVLSRAFFAGSQRVGPVWTGDNAADWDHLRVSIPMTLTLGVAGLTWSGADVGGFFGDPDPELATRWYQLGAFYPFFRGHAHLDTKRREPWMFGEPYTGFIRNAIRRRYALMPYLYTLFEEAHRTGAPVLRAMWYEFPDDDVVAAKDDVAMLGPALLVAPVLFKNAQERSTYLPAGTWYDYDTGEKFEGPTTVTKPTTIEDAPLYVRGGFVVPKRDRARRSVAAARGDPLTLLVAPDEFGNAVGDVYFDDGIGYGYLAEGGLETKKTSETSRFRKGSVGKNAPFGAFTRRVFSFTDGVLTNSAPSYSPSASGAGGDFPDAATRVERVVVMGADVSAYASTAEVRVFSKGEKEKDARTFRVDVERAATSERGGEKTSARAVAARKPDVAVADDWSVAFFFES
jgi:alpha 1,3-glucosidase